MTAPNTRHASTHVTVAWLASRLERDSELRLLDVSKRPAGACSPGFIPGASPLDWEGAFDAPPTLCPAPLLLAAVMSQHGVGDGHTIVVYDEGRGVRSLAVQQWLRRFGHRRVFVLDGGRADWLRQRRSLTRAIVSRPPGSFTVRITPVSDEVNSKYQPRWRAA